MGGRGSSSANSNLNSGGGNSYNSEMSSDLHTLTGGGGSVSENMEKLGVSDVGGTISALQHYSGAGYKLMHKGNYPEESDKIDSFIDKAPKYDGVLHRGMTVDTTSARGKAFLDNLQVGNEISFSEKGKGPTSWSADIETARAFSQSYSAENKSVIISMKNKHGASIVDVSKIPQESEILQKSTAKHRITKVKKDKKSGIIYVDMEEID